MAWTGEYSIGIPEIDEQHKQLFDCIERLESARDERQRELAVYFVVDELKDYVRVHFSVEEIVMRLFDYPLLDEHVAAHREFTARLAVLSRIELTHEAHAQAGAFLREWLTRHIMVSDKHYAAFLLGHGASVRS